MELVEVGIMEQLLVNAGSSLPYLAVVWMFVWKVWPGTQDLLEKNLDNKAAASVARAGADRDVRVTIMLDDNVAGLAAALVDTHRAITAKSGERAGAGVRGWTEPVVSDDGKVVRPVGDKS